MDAKKNRHFERILGKTVVTVVLIICGISCLLPLAWMISTSFKPELDVFEYPIRWIPKRWNFNTYKTVFTDDLFPIYFLNSAKVTFFSVVGNVFFSALPRNTVSCNSRCFWVSRRLVSFLESSEQISRFGAAFKKPPPKRRFLVHQQGLEPGTR